MDFAFSDEQRMLADSVSRLIVPAYEDLTHRLAMQKNARGYSEELWHRYQEMGLVSLPFSEEEGGFNGSAVETMIVMEAIGRGLALEPYLAGVVLSGALIRLGAAPAQRAPLIAQIAAGSLFAFAHSERQARHDIFDIATTARPTASGYILDGEKSLVLHGDHAEKFIVSARTSAAGRHDRHGITLFLVDADSPGLSRRGVPTQDGQRCATLSCANVPVGTDAIIGTPDTAGDIIEHAIDIAIAALCAEAVGAMAALHALTLDYLKTRTQFGVPIGNFQALQHKAVDMFTALEQARSMSFYAAMMADSTHATARSAALSAAKIQINKAARFLGQTAIQLHGGIGMTMQYRAGHYFKRLTMIETLFGDSAYHMNRLDGAGGLT